MESSKAFRLVMRRGPNPDKIFNLGKDYVAIGRETTIDVSISDPEVSRQHARLTYQLDGYTIEDLGSTNGTFVNGARITGAYSLMDGDEVGLGETVMLVYQVVESATPETILSPSAAFDLPDEPEISLPADPFEMVPPVEPEIETTPAFEPEPAAVPSPPFVSDLETDAPPPPPFAADPAPPPFEVEPEPAPMPPPPFPAERPIPTRAPTTAHLVTPPPVVPPGEAEKPKSRRGLLIGCGCLLLLVVCALVSGLGYLLWNAPVEFWNDPIGNFDRLFGMIMPLFFLF